MGSVALQDRARELFSEDNLPDEFGWVALLSPRHVRLFGVELNAALANPSPERLEALFESWKATAELDSAREVQDAIAKNRARKPQPLRPWPDKKKRATA